MREKVIATCEQQFVVGEKVVAYNWFDKKEPFNTGTYIKKYSVDQELHEEENCRKIDTKETRIYNIGNYKVEQILTNCALISPWDRFDERRLKNERKGN